MAEGDWVALPAVPKRAVEAVVHERSAQWRMFAYYAGFSVVAQVVTLLITWATGIEWNRALGAAVVLATLLVVWLVLRRQPDPPRALLADGSAWRVGERVREPEEVRRVVQLELPRRGGAPELWLRFGPDTHHPGIVLLREQGRPALDDAQREALIALLERAPIELPAAQKDPYDPKGRFSFLDRPNHLDRDAAIELVRDPPVSGLGRRPDQRAGG